MKSSIIDVFDYSLHHAPSIPYMEHVSEFWAKLIALKVSQIKNFLQFTV